MYITSHSGFWTHNQAVSRMLQTLLLTRWIGSAEDHRCDIFAHHHMIETVNYKRQAGFTPDFASTSWREQQFTNNSPRGCVETLETRLPAAPRGWRLNSNSSD